MLGLWFYNPGAQGKQSAFKENTPQDHSDEAPDVFCENEYTEQAISRITTCNKQMIGIIKNKYESKKIWTTYR